MAGLLRLNLNPNILIGGVPVKKVRPETGARLLLRLSWVPTGE
jgi:hypothetical protein